MGYGIAIAIIIEWWRRRKDRFKDPSASWMTDFVREELLSVDESKLSGDCRYERFLKRYNRQWRDKYGSESIYRLSTIGSLVTLYSNERRYYEARGWQNLAIQIMEFHQVVDGRLAAAYDSLAELELKMGRLQESAICSRKAAEIYKTTANNEALAKTLKALFDAYANRQMLTEALSVSDELVAVLEQLHGVTSLHIENHLSYAEMAIGNDRIPSGRREHYLLLTALHISEDALGEDHYAVANDLKRLATFFAGRGRVAVAADLSNRARMLTLLNKVGGVDYPGIEADLETVADWLEERNKNADRTVAFHMRKRVERIAERKRILKGKR